MNGSLSIDGDVALEGLAVAADRFSQTGTSQILGAAMAGHVRSTAPSLIEAIPTTGPALTWRCETGPNRRRSHPAAMDREARHLPGSRRLVSLD